MRGPLDFVRVKAHSDRMDLFSLAAAVCLGNLLTLSAFYSFKAFMAHDHNAPWSAYAGIMLPVMIVCSAVYLSH